MERIPPPPGFVDIHTVLGVRGVTPAQAAMNRQRMRHPARPRPEKPGLLSIGAPEFWQLIADGEFEAPTLGPWGNAWPLEAVLRWRDAQSSTK